MDSDSAVTSNRMDGTPTWKEDRTKLQTFTFSSKLKVVICVGDIFQSHTDMLVTGENRDLIPLSSVCRQYCLLEGTSEDKWRTDLKAKHPFYIEAGMVYQNTEPNSVAFDCVCHAIVPRYYFERPWLAKMSELYENIFRKAEKSKYHSIAMPLLMSGMYFFKCLYIYMYINTKFHCKLTT